jgi:hypothetical protein
MNLSQFNDDESKQAQIDRERADIVFFRDVPTLRKLIAVFEDDLRETDSGSGSRTIQRAGDEE